LAAGETTKGVFPAHKLTIICSLMLQNTCDHYISVTSGVLTVQQHDAPCIANTWWDQARMNRITSLAQHEYSSHCSLLYTLKHFNYMHHSLKYWHSRSVNIRYVYVFCTILTVNGDYFPEHINWKVFTVVLDCEPHEIRTEFFGIV